MVRNGEIKRAPIRRRGGARPDRKRKSARNSKAGTRLPIVKIGANKFPFDKSIKYLGVYYDEGMNVRKHCEYLHGKITIIECRDEDAVDQISSQAVNLWQAQWTSSSKGRTTLAFLPDIRERMSMGWLRPNHLSRRSSPDMAILTESRSVELHRGARMTRGGAPIGGDRRGLSGLCRLLQGIPSAKGSIQQR